jgi:hypothetical protein
VAPQGYQIRCGDDCQIETGSQVMRDAVEAIDPGCTHGTGRCLFLTVHELIDDEGSVRSREELAETYRLGLVPGIKCNGALFEDIVVNDWTRWKLASKFCDAFALIAQFNLGATQFFSLQKILFGFVRQVRLS